MSLEITRRLYKKYMDSDQQQEWCINCCWWKCGGKIGGENTPYEWGQCLLLPPTVQQLTKDISESYEEFSTIVSAGNTSVLPKTNHDDFCSLFKRNVTQ